MHQPQRHDDELLRRPDAVGRLGDLRGDGQRPRRRPPTSPAPPTSALHQAARLRLRGARRRPVRAGSRSPQAGRFAHEAVSFDPQGRPPLPDRGQLRLRRPGFYRYTPPAHPMKTGRLGNGGRLQMLAVKGSPTRTWRRARPGADVRRAVGRHRRPGPDLPLHAGPAGADDQRHRDQPRRRPGPGAGCGVLLAARGTRSTTAASSTSPRPRAAGRSRPGPTPTTRVRQRLGPGVGGTTPAPRPCASSTSRPGARCSTSPTTSPTAAGARWCSARTTPRTTTCAGLSRGGQLWDIALNRLQRHGAHRSNDEFAGSTFSPDGHTLFVNIQAGRGMTFAIWGPWQRIGV